MLSSSLMFRGNLTGNVLELLGEGVVRSLVSVDDGEKHQFKWEVVSTNNRLRAGGPQLREESLQATRIYPRELCVVSTLRGQFPFDSSVSDPLIVVSE